MNNNSQKLLVQCGIFTGIICAFFLTLSLFAVLSKSNWEKGLREAVWNVLPKQEYSVGKTFLIDEKPEDAICFELLDKESQKNTELVLVMRITTYYGPLPAVFVHRENKTSFAGIAYLKSSVAREFENTNNDRQISYWIEKADKIFRAALNSAGEDK